ncbi:MAG: hypothetical protein OMM_14502, partial [Candidatus Magnetoglobus multicellularis str. Araruama]
MPGTLHVWAYTDAAPDDHVGEIIQSIQANETLDVTLNLPEGTYFLKSYIDTNDNNSLDPGEPVCTHETTIVIGENDYPDIIACELSDLRTYQIISTKPEQPKAIVGRQLSFDLKYTTTDNNNMLSGIGLRIHYDSNFLSINSAGINQILTGIAGDPLIKDEDIEDGDLNTDKVIVLFWSDPLNAKWPSVTLPTTLCKLNFDVNSEKIREEKSTIHFTSSTNPSGYMFYAAPLQLTLRDFCLDIDGNGIEDALTDGLLILRYLAGLTEGNSLIGNAIGSNSIREYDNEIAEYIQSGY